MLVRRIYEDFLRHHEEHNEPATVRFYKQGLRWFINVFAEREWGELERLNVKGVLYKSWHKADGTPMSDATHRRNKVVFQQLQKHAIDQEFVENPLLTPKDLKKPGSGRREKVPTPDQLDAIIAAASPAMALAIRGFRACGMRPGELCRADIEMIETEGGVRSIVLRKHKTAKKTGRPRTIAIGEQLGEVIEAAIGERGTGPIWLDERGRRWTSERLGDRYRRLCMRLKMPAGMPLYTVRHFVGTWATRTAGIHAASHLLGHASISMTQRYAHADASDQLKAQAGIEGTTRQVGE